MDSEHRKKKNFCTLHTLLKAVDGTEYIQITERPKQMTGRGDTNTDSRVTEPNIISKGLRGVWFCRWKNLECREITKNKGFELANQ